jgi:hypothetical protein
VPGICLSQREIVSPKSAGVLPDSASSEQRQAQRRTIEAPDWLESANKFLAGLAKLEENWDGYGAAAPDPLILRSAASLLRSLAIELGVVAPDISPTRTAGVLFEWDVGTHHLEIQVVSSTAASYVYEDEARNFVRSGALFNDDPDPRCIEWLQNHFTSPH